ncbi:MAG: flagellin, partial [Nitrosopumilaceae archaeon]
AIIYWVVQQNQNSILERGEHVVIAIGYKDEDRPAALDKIRAELLLAQGATLTIERNVPNITNLIVDLG